MYPDGTLVRGPKALCELQGYVYEPGSAWPRSMTNRQQAACKHAAEEGGDTIQKI